MFSSDDKQKNPGEISTHSQANPPGQPTPETGTNTNTTNHNNEVNDKNSGDDSKKSPLITTTKEDGRCFTCPDFLRKQWCTNKADSDQDGSIRGKNDNSRVRMQHRLKKLKNQIKQIEDNVNELANFPKTEAYTELITHLADLRRIVEKESTEKSEASPSTKASVRRIAEINKDIMKITKHLSSPETMSKKLSLSAHLQPGTASSGSSAVHESVNVYQSTSFSSSSFHIEIQDIFNGLEREKKFILSCFTVFPENAVVKRRIFVFWGVGEGILDPESEPPEEIVDKILGEFQEKGLIEAAMRKRKMQFKSFKMHPLVRSAVISISKENKFFDYDDKGNVLPQRYWTSRSVSGGDQAAELEVNVSFPRGKRMCLLKAVELDQEQEQLLKKIPSIQKESQTTSTSNSATTTSNSGGTDLEKLVTLFNVNEPFPDLELAWLMKKVKNAEQIKEPSAMDWLSKMKDAQVVCLGSWPGSVKPHIEVESIEFLEGLKNSKGLRFLSLQGVSRIKELPGFIGNHSSLVILDLKECHNLEEVSKEIGKLTKLRYLDLSDCYLLARLPKELSTLVQLRVLKGFVISNPPRKGSATLEDLKELKNLRKLTINANSKDFPTVDDLTALQNIGGGVLRNLTIAWGATIADQQGEAQNGGHASCWQMFKSDPKQATKQHNPKPVTGNLPKQLEKLDLQCFPKSTATWLTPDSLKNLYKLYIRGGNLATLDRSKWLKVQALRLKYLRELKMNWRELNDSFPALEYLEKVKCPGITLCPCDEHGVWMKNPDQVEQK